IASMTTLPVIGVPIKVSVEGIDALLAIAQMPPGIPVATVAINGALNAAILSMQIMANGDKALQEKMKYYKQSLKDKIVKANIDLSQLSFEYKV
ncbi:MAG: AIR carboxylase family protein, partial [Bacteroidales bacterium]|nr:AIR carboxylase family protein [Bacteroidales bacterium]